MKRCPQCDFLYEEGQRLCDMDGTMLVHDPRKLPKQTKTSTGKSILQLVAIALPAGFLATVIVLYGAQGPIAQTTNAASETLSAPAAEEGHASGQPTHVTGERTPAQKSSVPQSPAETVSQEAAPTRDSDSIGGDKKAEPGTDPNLGNADTIFSDPQPSPAKHESKSKVNYGRSEQKNAHQKKDSTIGTLLKKTARALKKPFQL